MRLNYVKMISDRREHDENRMSNIYFILFLKMFEFHISLCFKKTQNIIHNRAICYLLNELSFACRHFMAVV